MVVDQKLLQSKEGYRMLMNGTYNNPKIIAGIDDRHNEGHSAVLVNRKSNRIWALSGVDDWRKSLFEDQLKGFDSRTSKYPVNLPEEKRRFKEFDKEISSILDDIERDAIEGSTSKFKQDYTNTVTPEHALKLYHLGFRFPKAGLFYFQDGDKYNLKIKVYANPENLDTFTFDAPSEREALRAIQERYNDPRMGENMRIKDFLSEFLSDKNGENS